MPTIESEYNLDRNEPERGVKPHRMKRDPICMCHFVLLRYGGTDPLLYCDVKTSLRSIVTVARLLFLSSSPPTPLKEIHSVYLSR